MAELGFASCGGVVEVSPEESGALDDSLFWVTFLNFVVFLMPPDLTFGAMLIGSSNGSKIKKSWL